MPAKKKSTKSMVEETKKSIEDDPQLFEKLKDSKKQTKKKSTTTKQDIISRPVPSDEGYMEGQDWVWPDGKKTHMRFIKDAVIRSKPLPKGFYKAMENSDSLSYVHMARVAKERGIPELK